jgi:LmbE family N-acetylglucosaminyl deacetylase
MNTSASSASPLLPVFGNSRAPIYGDPWTSLWAMPAVLIVAHPDDEVLAIGAQLPRLRQLWIAHVTDGAPRNLQDAQAAGFSTRRAYAQARRAELKAALGVAGLSFRRTIRLDWVDQEATSHLLELTAQLEKLLRELKPDVVLTHAYEGGHPDHDATAFAVHAARQLLIRRGQSPPELVEMPFYHAEAGEMIRGTFLAHPEIHETVLHLTALERERKRQLLACFRSQQRTLSAFPVEVERFRHAPAYDFTQPPHHGRLVYEQFDWGMTGQQWRELARQARTRLALQGPI